NSTYTTYTYDAAGQILSLANYAPDGSVNSRFDYTYDDLGRRTKMVTVDGIWTYSYDATGQLTHAAFAPLNPETPAQDLAYTYDAVGNRVSTVVNGAAIGYASNSLNEYIDAGSANYAYDADGNLISMSNTAGTFTFS